MRVAGRCCGRGVGIYDAQYAFQLCHSFCSCLCPDLRFYTVREFEVKPAPLPTPSCERAAVRNKTGEGSWRSARLAARLSGNCPCWLAQLPQPARYLPARDAGTRPRAPLAPPSCRPASRDRFRGRGACSDHRVPPEERVHFCVPAGNNHRAEIRWVFLRLGPRLQWASRGSCPGRMPCVDPVPTARV